MKLNRKLVLILSLVLSLALATGGTLAYLSDTDADVNVMTLGNVYIVQNEQERDAGNKLVEFTQNKELYPAVFEGSSIPWAPEAEWPGEGEAWKVVEKNPLVVDKFVTVTNTGNSDAYVRTLIAYEGDATYGPNGAYIHVVHNADNVDPALLVECLGEVEVEGVTYTVFSYTYPEKLTADETTIPSLKQIYMNKAADNDVVAQYGDEYEVIALSQAVQANGFADAKTALDTAFPMGDDAAATLAAWFGGAKSDIGSPSDKPYPDGWTDNNPPALNNVVTTDEMLLAAIEDESIDVIFVDGDLTYDWGGNSYANLKALLMKGKTFVGKDAGASITFKGYGSANPIVGATFQSITIKDATVGDNEGAWEHGHLEFEDLTANNVVFANSIKLAGDCTLTKCTMNNKQASWYGVWVEGGNVAITNCTFTGTRAIKIHEAYGSEVESVTVTDCTFTLSQKPGVVIGDLNADTTVTITGSTFDTTAGDQGLYIYETDTDVSTFKFSETGNTVK